MNIPVLYVWNETTQKYEGFSVIRGEKGEPGTPGAPGYTPVKGVDYWTEADEAGVIAGVLESLPIWEGGDY